MTTGPLSPSAPAAVPAMGNAPARKRRRTPSVGRSLWWFAIPALLLYLFIVIWPTIQGVGYSFTDWSAFKRQPDFVGFATFSRVLQGDLGGAAVRTIFIAVITMAIMNVAGLGLALVLNTRLKGRNVLRAVIFAPAIISSLVVGYLYKYIFGPPDIGAVNAVLHLLGLPQQDFLGNPTTALWIIVLVICWQFSGSAMIIYIAGLQGIPEELIEAAAIDGAGPFQRFWNVLRPLLAPAFTINLMLGLIGGLKVFDQVFALTLGGPANQTQTISTLIYQQFSQFGLWSRSAALAVLLAIGVAVLSFIQFAVLRRQEKNQ